MLWIVALVASGSTASAKAFHLPTQFVGFCRVAVGFDPIHNVTAIG